LAKLTDADRRLRRLQPAELADECGGLQADIAAIKAEMIRRNLTRADGDVFRLTLTAPGEHRRFDRNRYEADHGKLSDLYFRVAETDWQMRCSSRRRA
jgi:hypothetical protein